MNNFLKDNWFKILISLVFVCLVVFIFYLINQNVENRKFIDYQKSYIENKKVEINNQDIVKPTINQPIIKDNSVEIEKCKVSSNNISSENLQQIVDITNQVFESQFDNIKERQSKLLKIMLDDFANNPSSKNGEFYKIESDKLTTEKEEILQKQEEFLNQQMDDARQKKYLDCLKNIE